MTDTPAHTPLPWEVEKGHVQRDSNGIRYWQVTDGQDAIACNQFCYAGYDPAVNAANAAFIVRACNSHYQLVSALESANTLLTKAVGDIVAYRIMAGKRSSKSDTAEYVEAINAIDAALSQAGGASE